MASKNVIEALRLNGGIYYTANDGELNIKVNGNDVGSFNANEEQDVEIDISVTKNTVGLGNVDNTSDANKPISNDTQKALDKKQDKLTKGTGINIDENNVISTDALPGTTKYGASATMSVDPTTYIVTFALKDQDGNTLGTPQTIDLPLETVVVGGSFNKTTKKLVLELENGGTIEVPVGDLIAGLQTEITAENPLDADLVSDTTSTHKFVTAAEKTAWTGKQDKLVSGTNIKTVNGQSILGNGDLEITSGVSSVNGESGDVVLDADDIDDTNTTHKFVTTTEKNTWNNKADTSDIGNGTITVEQAGASMGSFSTNQSSNGTLKLAGSKAVTSTEYNNLPSTKATDGNLYIQYKTVTVNS